MKLSHRMVKNFCGVLSMSGKLDFPQLSEVNNSGVRISVRISTELGQPSGTIVSAATSLWLPLQPESIFNFFRDEKARVQVCNAIYFFFLLVSLIKWTNLHFIFQWDVLSNGNPVHEIAHILTGVHPGNSISIIRVMSSYDFCHLQTIRETNSNALEFQFHTSGNSWVFREKCQ